MTCNYVQICTANVYTVGVPSTLHPQLSCNACEHQITNLIYLFCSIVDTLTGCPLLDSASYHLSTVVNICTQGKASKSDVLMCQHFKCVPEVWLM